MDYYVATTGSDESGNGSIGNPWRNPEYGFSQLSAGDYLYIRVGTYYSIWGDNDAALFRIENLTGTSGNQINIRAYSGEEVIFDMSNITTIQPSCFAVFMNNCSWTNFEGIKVTGLDQPYYVGGSPNIAGVYTVNCDNCYIERIETHHMGGYGFSCKDSTYIHYLNCDAHHCADPYSSNGAWENANGFGCTGGVAENTSDHIDYTGCRAWHCCDDGFDFYGVDAYITLNSCWSFWNGYDDSMTHTGNGQGYKLGPPYTNAYSGTLRRVLNNCIAAHNYYNGFDQNSGGSFPYQMGMNLYNCLAYDNAQVGFQFSYPDANGSPLIFRNNLAYLNGAGTYAFNGSGTTIDHNSWDGGVNVSGADFSSLDISQLAGSRQGDGSLPDVTFGHLVAGSDLIDAGVDVGLDYSGSAPDMGAFEYSSGGGNIVLTVEGQNLISEYDTLHDDPTTFTFRNNSIQENLSASYILSAGDEAPADGNNNLNGAVITGNAVLGVGDPLATLTHGIFVGYNINDIIKWNYLENIPYGVVTKSGESGTGMTWSSGGIFYNIFKNCVIGVIVRGVNGIKIYNNTFYSSLDSAGTGALVYVQENESQSNSPLTGTKIKNNIFYTTHYGVINIFIEDASCESGFESDYNIFYCEGGVPLFAHIGDVLTFTEWQALGYDTHSVVVDPNFINTDGFVPTTRINDGTNLGTTWNTGLAITASWDFVTPTLATQDSNWQVGAMIYGTEVPQESSENPTGVPNTNNFTLGDVCDVVNPAIKSLRNCFITAGATIFQSGHVGGFDSNYEGNHDRLSNFRNYQA